MTRVNSPGHARSRARLRAALDEYPQKAERIDYERVTGVRKTLEFNGKKTKGK